MRCGRASTFVLGGSFFLRLVLQTFLGCFLFFHLFLLLLQSLPFGISCLFLGFCHLPLILILFLGHDTCLLPGLCHRSCLGLSLSLSLSLSLIRILSPCPGLSPGARLCTGLVLLRHLSYNGSTYEQPCYSNNNLFFHCLLFYRVNLNSWPNYNYQYEYPMNFYNNIKISLGIQTISSQIIICLSTLSIYEFQR